MYRLYFVVDHEDYGWFLGEAEEAWQTRALARAFIEEGQKVLTDPPEGEFIGYGDFHGLLLRGRDPHLIVAHASPFYDTEEQLRQKCDDFWP